MPQRFTAQNLLDYFDAMFGRWRMLPPEENALSGVMVQGYFTIKRGEKCQLIPFVITDEKALRQIRDYILKLGEADEFAVCFAQRYQHNPMTRISEAKNETN